MWFSQAFGIHGRASPGIRFVSGFLTALAALYNIVQKSTRSLIYAHFVLWTPGRGHLCHCTGDGGIVVLKNRRGGPRNPMASNSRGVTKVVEDKRYPSPAMITAAKNPSPGSRPGIRRIVSTTSSPGTESTTSSFSSRSSEQVE